MPYVLELTERAARMEIISRGLTVGTVSQHCNDNFAEGIVIYQSPQAGVQREPGSPVDLTVSTGPCPAGCDSTQDIIFEDTGLENAIRQTLGIKEKKIRFQWRSWRS